LQWYKDENSNWNRRSYSPEDREKGGQIGGDLAAKEMSEFVETAVYISGILGVTLTFGGPTRGPQLVTGALAAPL
jgi:hypothetical protein